jgi:hypothetical protein
MYYLIMKTMGRKRCIDINKNDIYYDGQLYDCLKLLPFDENSAEYERPVQIRCINAPDKKKSVDVYKDKKLKNHG